MTRIKLVLLFSVMLLESCAVGPDYKRPAMTLPDTYTTIPTNTTKKPSSHRLLARELPQRVRAAKRCLPVRVGAI